MKKSVLVVSDNSPNDAYNNLKVSQLQKSVFIKSTYYQQKIQLKITPNKTSFRKSNIKNMLQFSKVDYSQKRMLNSQSDGNLLNTLQLSINDPKRLTANNQFQISSNNLNHLRSTSSARREESVPVVQPKFQNTGRTLDYSKNQLLNQLITKINRQEDPQKTLTQTRLSVASKPPPTPKQTSNSRVISKRPPGMYPLSSMNSLSLFKPNEHIKGKVSSITPTMRPAVDSNYDEHKGLDSQHQKRQEFCQYYLKSIFESFSKVMSTDYFQKLFREHFYQTYQGIYFAQFFKPIEPQELKNKKVRIPRDSKSENKITLVFDLDETLVHCNENLSVPSDVILSIKINNQDIINAGVNIRPGATEILEELYQDFEIFIFTASHQCYAQEIIQKVIKQLDPNQKYVRHSLFRNHCVMTTGGVFTKDLRIFADRSLEQLVLIDNASYSYAWQLDNGIPILPYYDNKKDDQLQQLKIYLKGMIGCKDVREYNRNNLRLHNFNDSIGPQRVFEKIFGRPMDHVESLRLKKQDKGRSLFQ